MNARRPMGRKESVSMDNEEDELQRRQWKEMEEEQHAGRKNDKAIMGVFKQFGSRRNGKTCNTGATCALSLFGQMGLSPYLASEVLYLFRNIGNCCVGETGNCDLPLEANLGVDLFMSKSWPEDSEEERGK